MKIFEINSGNYGSTGNIMLNIAETARLSGYSVKVAYRQSRSVTANEKEEEIQIGNSFYGLTHRIIGEYLGLEGFGSIISTSKLIKEIKNFNPDIIHLHILHGWYLNLPLLFSFLAKYNKKVVWTMHDCWAFTGHCPHFEYVKCNKWQTGCRDCPQYREYPYSRIDTSKFLYKCKRKYFTAIKNLTVVTPSQWLADLIEKSYLQNAKIQVINNGIDLNVFKSVESNFRELNNINENANLILGVAFEWTDKKGIDIFKKLSNDLSDNYKIVLIGTTEETEKDLPQNIIKIRRTSSKDELASIYSSADLFVNPTREETFPTVNMEALACGTPVLTFKTGGSPEIIDKKCGSVVECDDYENLKSEIIRICETKPFLSFDCTDRAKSFDMNDKFKEYVKLYETI
ncbi:MAG: glycosyltransferase [Ruminococcaceae bacterium]|nr:glycosyltransferase [Oscillospiraceae bacterium]